MSRCGSQPIRRSAFQSYIDLIVVTGWERTILSRQCFCFGCPRIARFSRVMTDLAKSKWLINRSPLLCRACLGTSRRIDPFSLWTETGGSD